MPGELLPEDGKDRADAAADLEKPRSRLERGAVRDQPVPPVLCLLDQALLLARAVTVNVVGHRRKPTAVALRPRLCAASRRR